MLNTLGIHLFQQCIHNSNKDTNCNCGNKIQENIEYNKYVIFDVETDRTDKIELKKIPNIIEINQLSYQLKAMVEFIDLGGKGHYVAHLKRPNQKWEGYDDLKRTVYATPNYLQPHILFYTCF